MTYQPTARLPRLSVKLEEGYVDLYLPCPQVNELFKRDLKLEVGELKGLLRDAWAQVSSLFNASFEEPVLKVVESEIFIVHPNFMAGGAYSEIPMLIRYDGSRYEALFHKPVVAVNPYVYYFESLARGRKPVILQALIHEYAHVAFLLGGGLRLELLRRIARRPRLGIAMQAQLPYEKLAENAALIELLMEVPALWAEERVASKYLDGVGEAIDRRLKLHAARDEALSSLLVKHGFNGLSASSKVYVETLLNYWYRVRGAGCVEVQRFVEGLVGSALGLQSLEGCYSKLEESCEIKLVNDYLEAPTVNGKTLERLSSWYGFLEKVAGKQLTELNP